MYMLATSEFKQRKLGKLLDRYPFQKGVNMSKFQRQKVKELKSKGFIENKDFRVVYFGIHAEIKFL